MAKLCLCLTGKTMKKDLEILNKYRKIIDVAELRVDCLDADERLYIRRFPELAGVPVILTIRRDVDGGHFSGGEGARVKILANGLAYANEDSRLNFAYIDIEDDFDVPSIEEAARTFGTRIIRSYHNTNDFIENIPEKMKSMRRAGDEIVKVALTVKSTQDVLKIYEASKLFAGKDKILIGMGHYGVYSRILAEHFGSFLTYSSPLHDNVTTGGPGQIDITELAELYHFRKLTKKTKIYGAVGNPLKKSVSPWFFNTIFNLENTDSVYVPFPASSIDDFMTLAKELEVQGLSITVPYKESVLSHLLKKSSVVQSVGACNTVYRSANEWHGDNTDCGGFAASLLQFIGKKNLKYLKISIIGAGGVSRAVASEVSRLGGKALILNRTVHKAKNIAAKYNFRWGGLDNHGIEDMYKFNDIIIQTSSVGMDGYDTSDPIESYTFTGKEAVMDLIYTPPVTPLLERAMSAGCKTMNGYDMVIRQACMQYTRFFEKEIPEKLILQVEKLGAEIWNKIQ
ncbi:MAG: type I 3-dehydroquinate dehydratase [Treponema sp.]|nr:type I 3-dehydroquinate dehydratase [Treponema sp.]